MSSYYIYDEVEALLTSTTTSILGSSDALIVHNVATNKKYQTTPGSVSAQEQVTFASTLTSTTTLISPYGTTIFKSTGGSSAVWVLADPTSVGLTKTLVLGTTTTSTYYTIIPQSATIGSTAAAGGSLINLGSTATGSNQANSVTVTAQTTALWLVISKNGSAIYS